MIYRWYIDDIDDIDDIYRWYIDYIDGIDDIPLGQWEWLRNRLIGNFQGISPQNMALYGTVPPFKDGYVNLACNVKFIY